MRSTRLSWNKVSIFYHARLQPLANQAENATVTDTVLDETNQPRVADRVEGSYDTLPIIRTFPSKLQSSALGIRLKVNL